MLQMAKFYSFLWLGCIPLYASVCTSMCVCTFANVPLSVSVCLLMDTEVGSTF